MRLLILITFSMLLMGCAANVVYDYDSAANFQQDQTVAFEVVESGSVQSLDYTRIHEAISRQLKRKGYTLVEDGNALLEVRYRIEEASRIEATGVTYGVGMSRNRVGMAMHTPIRAREIKEGKLVVEMVEAKDQRVIWRAVSQKRLTEQMKPESRTQLINELVSEMFENYPPQKK